MVGSIEGLVVGDDVLGAAVGLKAGINVGTVVGLAVGFTVGIAEGTRVGCADGATLTLLGWVGITLGFTVGFELEGLAVGNVVLGAEEIEAEGATLGSLVGFKVGAPVGTTAHVCTVATNIAPFLRSKVLVPQRLGAAILP